MQHISSILVHIVLQYDLAHSPTNKGLPVATDLGFSTDDTLHAHRCLRLSRRGKQDLPLANIEGPCVCSSYHPLVGVSFALLLLHGAVPAHVATLSATLLNRHLDVPAVRWPCAVGFKRKFVCRLLVVC